MGRCPALAPGAASPNLGLRVCPVCAGDLFPRRTHVMRQPLHRLTQYSARRGARPASASGTVAVAVRATARLPGVDGHGPSPGLAGHRKLLLLPGFLGCRRRELVQERGRRTQRSLRIPDCTVHNHTFKRAGRGHHLQVTDLVRRGAPVTVGDACPRRRSLLEKKFRASQVWIRSHRGAH